MFCKNCGRELDDNAVICPGCGVPTDKMLAQSVSEPKNPNGMGIAGFATGLFGMFVGNFMFLMPGIVALILSIIGVAQIKKCNSANGLAVAGLSISIISFLFWLLIWIIVIMEIINGGGSGDIPLY